MDLGKLLPEILKILGFIGFLAFGSVLLLRVRGTRGGPKGYAKTLHVVETLSLGGNRLVCRVRDRDCDLLLGVTDQRVTLLKESKVEDLEQTPVETIPHKQEGFAQELSRLIKERMGRHTICLLAFALTWSLLPSSIARAASDSAIPAVGITIDGIGQGGLGASLGILGLLTVLSLAPAIVMLTTSFTRIVIVFSFLRSGLGTQQTPPNQVLVGLALIITFFVMSPTWGEVYETAIQPYIDGEIAGAVALDLASGPMKDFMLRETRDKDLALFVSMASQDAPQYPEDLGLLQVVPAFALSELRTAFEMGFVLYLPFLVIDMVVASTLMSMGMLMLPPVLISLPFKLLLFVLVDGWNIVTRSLIAGFGS